MGNQWGARGRGTRSGPAAREEPRSRSERFGAFGGWSSHSRAGPAGVEERGRRACWRRPAGLRGTGEGGGQPAGGSALACAGRGGSLDRKPEPVTVNAQ